MQLKQPLLKQIVNKTKKGIKLMKKLLSIMVLSCIAGLVMATTVIENKTTIQALSTLQERIDYYNTLPALEQVNPLALGIASGMLVSDNANRVSNSVMFLEFSNTSLFAEHNKHVCMYAMSIIGNTSALLNTVTNTLDTAVSSLDTTHKTANYRAAAFWYTHDILSEYSTVTERADVIAKALLIPHSTLSNTDKMLIERWFLYGSMSTTHSVKEVFIILERDFKPRITNGIDAMWWGINVDSRTR